MCNDRNDGGNDDHYDDDDDDDDDGDFGVFRIVSKRQPTNINS